MYLKKIGKYVRPAAGFTVIATANTKGKGSDDGRFVGTNVLNEAFLERFPITIEQSILLLLSRLRFFLLTIVIKSSLRISSSGQELSVRHSMMVVLMKLSLLVVLFTLLSAYAIFGDRLLQLLTV